MNTADSEEMAQPLKDRGFLATGDIEQADVVLMNTCTVRDQAEHRAKSNLGRLREWKAANPDRILIVAGCAASRWGDSIQKRYPYIDLVSPATQIENFPTVVEQVLKERWDGKIESARHFEDATLTPANTAAPSTELFGDANTAYITIMRGCNYSCSYCIVPQVRGREVYRPLDQILANVRAKVAEGFSEVMLLGQTVNSYFSRGGEEARRQERDTSSLPRDLASSRPLDFADLLRAVNDIPGVERIRFMSPHPRHMRDRVIEAMRDCTKVCRHIHLPVQSGSDKLLAQMKRLYTAAEYRKIVNKLRAAMPGLLVTTDLIVGYPGETEQDLEDSLELMREIRFDGLFAFKYSPRPGTASAEEVDDVPADVKEARLQTVLALNRSIVQMRTENHGFSINNR